LCVVERATNAEEIREEKIAVDQPVDRLVSSRLLQALKRIARRSQQLAPTAATKYTCRRLGAISFGSDREIERDLLAAAGGDAN